MKFQFLPSPKPAHIESDHWNDWRWQFKNSLKSKQDFEAYFQLSTNESSAFDQLKDLFKSQTTPYYASLADRTNPSDGLRKVLMPSIKEASSGVQEMLDPLGENRHSPVDRIIHRYPDRLLFLVTDLCSVYCRYCTRKHFTGKDQAFAKSNEYQKALEYIKKQKGVREVILSGGDPLTLSDSILDKVLSDLRSIDHIEIIRIGTRMPVVNPMRVTSELVETLKKYHPLFMMVHFNHPKELTLEASEALLRLVDYGFPVMNQMVLLNGVNNHEAIVQALSRRLLYLRVKPYYMFQCDPSEGTDHLRTSIDDSKKIQSELWGRLSGLAMPNLSIDIPDGGGKVGVVPDFEIDRTENARLFKGWDGHVAEYKSPPQNSLLQPSDLNDYLEEWQGLKNQPYGDTR